MEHWVYILQSQSTGRYYCGQTREITTRVVQHNDPTNDLAKTTKRFQGPWKLVWSRQVVSGSEAMRLERKIKKRGIGRFLEGQSYSSKLKAVEAQPRSRCKRD